MLEGRLTYCMSGDHFSNCPHVQTSFCFSGQSTYDTKGKTAINSAYRYDPRFNEWLQIASLNENRTFFHLSALKGKLFAVGGRNATGDTGELLLFLPIMLTLQYQAALVISVSPPLRVRHNGVLQPQEK